MKTENKVCLYIFTHNITGLKYFGKTTKSFTKEELIIYGGSGVYWNNHKKVHGNDLSVEIYGIFHKDEVKEIALTFSKDNNIVKAVNESGDRIGKKIWANEQDENGLDGRPSGLPMSEEAKNKISEANKGSVVNEETRKKIGDANRGNIKDIKEHIIDFNNIHNNKYCYSKSITSKSKEKIIIVCPYCGEFSQSINAHKKGNGCPYCKRKEQSKSQKHTNEEVVESFIKTHGNKYNYDKVVYIKNNKKIIIICKEHGDFSQTPNSHKQGHGCPKCALDNHIKK